MMKYLIFFAIMLLAVFGIYHFFASSKYDNRLDILLSRKPVILDVRSASEFKAGHISGALNTPLGSLETIPLSRFDKRRPLITCCSHGVRSAQAVQVLRARGLKNAYDGGAWPDRTYRSSESTIIKIANT